MTISFYLGSITLHLFHLTFCRVCKGKNEKFLELFLFTNLFFVGFHEGSDDFHQRRPFPDLFLNLSNPFVGLTRD